MFRFGAITLLAALAFGPSCSGKSKRDTGAPGGDGDGDGDGDKVDAGTPAPKRPRRVLHIAPEYIVLDPDAAKVRTRVSLILTDETGSTRREIVGEFDGGCSDVSVAARGEALKPIIGVDCWSGDRGRRLRFVHSTAGNKNKIYVVTAEGPRDAPEVDYQPLTTIDLEPGIPVVTDHDPPK